MHKSNSRNSDTNCDGYRNSHRDAALPNTHSDGDSDGHGAGRHPKCNPNAKRESGAGA